MKPARLPFELTGQFESIFLDYLYQDAKIKPFGGASPTIEAFEAQLQRSFPAARRQVLRDVLTQQYAHIPEAPTAQIEALLAPNTFTVTTGHQLNLMTGPLYVIYKLVSTIRLAHRLTERYPGYQFVPVYWMATEDHDFQEIDHFHYFQHTVKWEKPNPTGATGRMSLEGIEEVLGQVPDLPDFFKEAYQQGTRLADAVRRYMHTLFGAHGLVILDADDARLKRSFVEVMQDDLLRHTAFHQVTETSHELSRQGYKVQINPRQINLFRLEGHQRIRIEVAEAVNGVPLSYRLADTDIRFGRDQLLAELAASPEKFSPNVVLRPLYQETVLPNLAAIGGPSELAYWLQLRALFQHHKIPYPILMPRNFALVLTHQNAQKMRKLGVRLQDFFLPDHELRRKYVEENSENNLRLEKAFRQLEGIFEELRTQVSRVDPTLVATVAAESKNAAKSLEQIERKIRKAEERNQETSLNQLFNLKAKLFPNGNLQERRDNLLTFYLQDPHFLDRLFEFFDPFEFKFLVLEYEQ